MAFRNKEMTPYQNTQLPVNEPTIPGWFSTKQLSFLYHCVLYADARNCIELGSYMGRSAYGICLALNQLGGQRRLLCVDIFASPLSDEYFEMPFMKDMMGRYPDVAKQYSNYHVYPTTLHCFYLTLSRYPFMKEFVEIMATNTRDMDLGDETFDFALIDADHTYDGVKHDFGKILPHLRDGSIVVFDDNSPHFPGVQSYINELKKTNMVTVFGEVENAIGFRIFAK